MKRDWDIIRSTLSDAEVLPPGMTLMSSADNDEDLIEAEHMALLVDAGLCYGIVQRSESGTAYVSITGMTWAGFDFYDSIQQDSAWEKVKAVLLKHGGSLPFEILKTLATSALADAVGLKT